MKKEMEDRYENLRQYLLQHFSFDPEAKMNCAQILDNAFPSARARLPDSTYAMVVLVEDMKLYIEHLEKSLAEFKK